MLCEPDVGDHGGSFFPGVLKNVSAVGVFEHWRFSKQVSRRGAEARRKQGAEPFPLALDSPLSAILLANC
jgi:hypothetical protein